MNTPKWTDADFALMSGPELDHAHKALADAWCQHTSSKTGAIGDVTANALQAQMRRIGYLMNPATEASLRRDRQKKKQPQGIVIAPGDEYLPEVNGQKRGKDSEPPSIVDTADRSVKTHRKRVGGTVAASTDLTERDIVIISMRRNGATWPAIAHAVGTGDKAVSNRFYLLKRAGVAEAQI